MIWRHDIGNVGPTVRSLILKCWQCGPTPQCLACGSGGNSSQMTAIASFVVDARGPTALAAVETAAANRSAALIVILFNIYRVPCRLRVTDVQVFERMVRMVTRGHAPPTPCEDAPQLWPPSPLGISKTASCCALMGANLNQSRTTVMTTSQQAALAGRSAPSRQSRAGSWIARLFSQPVVREISQATEWDNDVPPLPILAGAVARPERRGQSQ